IGCLVPFLSVHIQEIGITAKESAWINTISAVVSIFGPLIAVPVAYKYNKFRALIVLTLVFSGVFYTSLLFVPKVIRTPRLPQMVFDCTNSQLQIEQCPDWEGLAKVATIAIPLSIWSPLCGYLVDFYSTLAGFSDYAPPFILFDGMVLISCALAIALPIAPFTSPILSIQSQTSLRSLNNCRRHSTEREKVPLKSKCVLVFLFPIVLVLGTQWGLLETYLLPFYLQMNSSKLWIGLTFTITFLSFTPFALVIKSMTSAVGRSHLIVLGFIFYALRLSGISFLSKPRWTLIPFEAMEAFTLPIAWIGITSYCHHLIQRSSRGAEMLRNGVSSSTSTHLMLQILLIITHFGIGRALGTFCWALWDWRWIDDNHLWTWLTEAETDDSSYSFRYRPRKPSKKRKQTDVQTPVVLNGVHYSRLVEKDKDKANDVQSPIKQTNGDTHIKMIDAADDEAI
ncbi:hypothetical protein B4U80_05127, partial [Leptotrombidium deliense]